MLFQVGKRVKGTVFLTSWSNWAQPINNIRVPRPNAAPSTVPPNVQCHLPSPPMDHAFNGCHIVWETWLQHCHFMGSSKKAYTKVLAEDNFKIRYALVIPSVSICQLHHRLHIENYFLILNTLVSPCCFSWVDWDMQIKLSLFDCIYVITPLSIKWQVKQKVFSKSVSLPRTIEN